MHSPLKTISLPRALLLGLIGAYRRRLAGRAPFRNVCCTFAQIESCSAFGERMAREAPSTWIAIRLILGRLRRCRELSLYRRPDGTLAGGRGYDSLAQLPTAFRDFDKALEQAGENETVRSAVREAALVLWVHYQASRPDGVARSAFARSVSFRSAKDDFVLIVRSASAVRRLLARRLRRRGAMSIVFWIFAAATAVAGTGIAIFPLLPRVATLTAASAWASHRLIARINRLESLAAIEGPVTLRQATAEPRLGMPALSHVAHR